MAYISFLWCLGLLFGIQSCLYAEGQDGIMDKYALISQQVNLTCNLNSIEDVTWLYRLDENYFPEIYTCEYNQNGQCTSSRSNDGLGLSIYSVLNLQATRSNDTSVLSLTIKRLYEGEIYFQCKLGNNILQEYSVKSTDPRNIIPNCTITSPHSDENGVGSMTLSCEVNSGELNVSLTLEGIGLNGIDDSPRSSQSIKAKTLYFDDFKNVRNASCKAYFPEIDLMQSCTYPNIIKAQYIVEENDIIVKCADDSDVYHWRFYGSDGREVDMEDGSWMRDGGRSLLIRDISERHIWKVAVCRTSRDDNQTNKGTIGFTIISENMSGDNSNSEVLAPTPRPNAHNPYLVLMLLFLSLWLITTAVGGVWLGCTPKGDKSGTLAIASASGNASVPNGGSGERGTSLINVGTGARGDPNTLNTNNSAHHPASEPEVNIVDKNNRNRQSNNESHLYFTLEKSSPSPVNSLPRASTARWEHPDTNPASLNQPQSSHWQGYEIVGESNMGATSSYDLGEYAEVGYQIQGKGPPDLGEYAEVGGHFQGKGPTDLSGRPSIRKMPGREKVKGNDISSLYSKVNK